MIRRESLVFLTLVSMARQRSAYDEHRCHALLEMLATADGMRTRIRGELGADQVTELQFGALVALLAVDPDPCFPATLAAQSGSSRAAMTDALGHLETRRLIRRERPPDDRRLRLIRLTPSGRKRGERCISVVLKTLGELGHPLNTLSSLSLMALCDKLEHGHTPPASSTPARATDAVSPRRASPARKNFCPK